MKINIIKSKKTHRNEVTKAIIPDWSYPDGNFTIVGINHETNEVYVVNERNHYYENGIPLAKAYDASKCLFVDFDGKEHDFDQTEEI